MVKNLRRLKSLDFSTLNKQHDELRKAYMAEALRRTDGNISHAASLCGVQRTQFYRLKRRFRL